MTIRAGKLNKKVRIVSYLESSDRYGEATRSDDDTTDYWASITPIGSTEQDIGDKSTENITHTIIIRHGINISPKDKILWDSRVFEIESLINVDEKNREYKIMAREII